MDSWPLTPCKSGGRFPDVLDLTHIINKMRTVLGNTPLQPRLDMEEEEEEEKDKGWSKKREERKKSEGRKKNQEKIRKG